MWTREVCQQHYDFADSVLGAFHFYITHLLGSMSPTASRTNTRRILPRKTNLETRRAKHRNHDRKSLPCGNCDGFIYRMSLGYEYSDDGRDVLICFPCDRKRPKEGDKECANEHCRTVVKPHDQVHLHDQDHKRWSANAAVLCHPCYEARLILQNQPPSEPLVQPDQSEQPKQPKPPKQPSEGDKSARMSIFILSSNLTIGCAFTSKIANASSGKPSCVILAIGDDSSSRNNLQTSHLISPSSPSNPSTTESARMSIVTPSSKLIKNASLRSRRQARCRCYSYLCKLLPTPISIRAQESTHATFTRHRLCKRALSRRPQIQ